jgi:hypothetical protein
MKRRRLTHYRFVLYCAGYPVSLMTDQEVLEAIRAGIC